MLKCPKCNNKLIKLARTYQCESNHTYDIAKEGYVNLVLNYNDNSGDNKALIEARHHFLNLDYYLFLRNALIDIIQYFPHNIILDAGCGEGYYTNELQKYFKTVIGIDLSKSGIKKASKQNNSVIYAINSIQNIAVMEKSVDIVLSIFSYRNLNEFKRVLKDSGYYIEVVPDTNHLIELKTLIYDQPYLNEIDENVLFEKIDTIYIKDKQYLSQEELQSLFKMTPYYYRTNEQDKLKLETLKNLEVTFAFVINIYMKKGEK